MFLHNYLCVGTFLRDYFLNIEFMNQSKVLAALPWGTIRDWGNWCVVHGPCARVVGLSCRVGPLKEETLGLALGSPIFPSGCEGKLGVALESLQGLRDLT